MYILVPQTPPTLFQLNTPPFWAFLGNNLDIPHLLHCERNGALKELIAIYRCLEVLLSNIVKFELVTISRHWWSSDAIIFPLYHSCDVTVMMLSMVSS